MKKMLLPVSAAFCLLLGSSVFADTKIGVIDVNKIFLESPQVAEAKADFKKKFEGREKELRDTQQTFQKAVETFSKNSPTMKADAQKAEQQKLIEQQKKLQEMQSKFQNDANVAQEGAMKKFSKKMEDSVNKVSAEKNLDLVVAKASLAYNKKELEITDEVIKQMKK